MQSRFGLWLVGLFVLVALFSVGYGMGRRSVLQSRDASTIIAPAGAPLPTIEIEPIQAQEEIQAITAPIGTEAPAVTAPEVQQAPARVEQIQKALQVAGYDPGPADGKMGPKTKNAIKDFQMANNLSADGKVGPKTWTLLAPYLEEKKETP